jgi:protein-S-isoprenylcysteine O-methyltransferase Ste14
LVLVGLFFLEKDRFQYFLGSRYYDRIYGLCCFAVTLSGFLVRVMATGYARAGTSGRNTKGQYAEKLNTDGPYSVVRNPLYAGNIVIITGVALLSQSFLMTALIFLLALSFYTPIILREEEFLSESFKEGFSAYAQGVPALLPDFKLWKKPELKFNLARVLYREHDTYMGIAFGFFAVQTIRQSFINGKLYLDKFWGVIFIISLLIWTALKNSKKYLKSLDKGR